MTEPYRLKRELDRLEGILDQADRSNKLLIYEAGNAAFTAKGLIKALMDDQWHSVNWTLIDRETFINQQKEKRDKAIEYAMHKYDQMMEALGQEF